MSTVTLRRYIGEARSFSKIRPTKRTPQLKILHLTDLFSPSIGGMENHVLELVRERHRRGHEMVVVTLQKVGEPSSAIEDTGYRVYRIDGGYTKLAAGWSSPDKPFHPPAPDPVVAYKLKQILDIERPDVVHAHNWMIYSYLAIKGRHSPPVLWMQHDYSLPCSKKTAYFYKGDGTCPGPSLQSCLPCSKPQYGSLKGAAITLGLFGSNAVLIRRVDAVVSNSAGVNNFTRSVIHDDQDFGVVPSFIPARAFETTSPAERPSWLPSGPYILYVGAFGVHKGIFDLLAAYGQLRGDVALVLLGTPRSDMPTRWPKGSVVRMNVPRDEVFTAWRYSSFGVIPSRWPEPFGLGVLEAGSNGKTVVATRGGGLGDLVLDELTGLLVDSGDVVALARAMQRLVDDVELRDRLSKAAKIRSSEYTIERAVDQLDAICQVLISKHSGDTP